MVSASALTIDYSCRTWDRTISFCLQVGARECTTKARWRFASLILPVRGSVSFFFFYPSSYRLAVGERRLGPLAQVPDAGREQLVPDCPRPGRRKRGQRRRRRKRQRSGEEGHFPATARPHRPTVHVDRPDGCDWSTTPAPARPQVRFPFRTSSILLFVCCCEIDPASLMNFPEWLHAFFHGLSMLRRLFPGVRKLRDKFKPRSAFQQRNTCWFWTKEVETAWRNEWPTLKQLLCQTITHKSIFRKPFFGVVNCSINTHGITDTIPHYSSSWYIRIYYVF